MRTRVRAAALLTVAVLALGACKASVNVSSGESSPAAASGGSNTYSDNGVTFQYPSSWTTHAPASMAAQTGSAQWTTTLASGQGQNLIIVTAYGLNFAVNSGNIDKIKSQVSQTLGNIAQQAGGTFGGNLAPTTMGGFPGYQADITVGGGLASSVVVVFDGQTEYFMNCQYDSSGKSDVLAACDQVKGSFQATG